MVEFQAAPAKTLSCAIPRAHGNNCISWLLSAAERHFARSKFRILGSFDAVMLANSVLSL